MQYGSGSTKNGYMSIVLNVGDESIRATRDDEVDDIIERQKLRDIISRLDQGDNIPLRNSVRLMEKEDVRRSWTYTDGSLSGLLDGVANDGVEDPVAMERLFAALQQHAVAAAQRQGGNLRQRQNE